MQVVWALWPAWAVWSARERESWRSAALRAGLRRKERIVSLLPRHLPFSSQARLGTVPGYYQPSRCAGLDLDAANGVESHPLKRREEWAPAVLFS
jgi:hypothetical protein